MKHLAISPACNCLQIGSYYYYYYYYYYSSELLHEQCIEHISAYNVCNCSQSIFLR